KLRLFVLTCRRAGRDPTHRAALAGDYVASCSRRACRLRGAAIGYDVSAAAIPSDPVPCSGKMKPSFPHLRPQNPELSPLPSRPPAPKSTPTMKTKTVLPSLAILLVLAAPGRAQVSGHYQDFGDVRGFLNIVPPGQDGVLNGPEA